MHASSIPLVQALSRSRNGSNGHKKNDDDSNDKCTSRSISPTTPHPLQGAEASFALSFSSAHQDNLTRPALRKHVRGGSVPASPSSAPTSYRGAQHTGSRSESTIPEYNGNGAHEDYLSSPGASGSGTRHGKRRGSSVGASGERERAVIVHEVCGSSPDFQ